MALNLPVGPFCVPPGRFLRLEVLLVPANGATPVAIINALNREVAQALTDPELRKKFLNDNSTPAPPRSPDELRKIFLADMEKWDSVVKKANIKLEE